MKTSDIRQKFQDFFAQNQHQPVESSSLIPHGDATLLFTNAGMNQFKDTFLGVDKRDYVRATSCQKCVRAGGKHNDLENVGYTARHHTFFEMLGNFSFGDYFKREAIQFAWDFLTKELGLPEEKLWITVHHSDSEAEKIWLEEMGVSAERFSRLDEDNFWQMGDTGPCGPCTEIFYDHGEQYAGGPPGSPDDDLDRYIEIWNLVFMQYDRQPDGELKPLPKPSVDTGMGLERIAAVKQGVNSNYDIDIFQSLIGYAQKATGATDKTAKSLRVIADHIRSCSFLIADGVQPSNDGRGYVLRRIIRRAIRHGHMLGQPDLFFFKMVQGLVDVMGDAYPYLKEQQQKIEDTLKREEQQFAKTLDNGLKIVEESIAELTAKGEKEFSGELVFRLYDTYGFPMDLTADLAREKGFTIDEAGFEACMQAQRERARQAGKFEGNYHEAITIDQETAFLGYELKQAEAQVTFLAKEGAEVSSLSQGDTGILVLDKTPFYAESGGQVGDKGLIETAGAVVEVKDTTKQGQAFLHHVVIQQGDIAVGDNVQAKIDEAARQHTERNHSATHLMHAALRDVLGEHVEQKGSLVNSSYLRFDFSNPEPVSAEQMAEVEQLVNAQILANAAVETELMDFESATKKGAMALFGEKYDDEVRVLSMGQDNFSVELCGGTHVSRTGDIGVFSIRSEGGVASGVRRIEAVTGEGALAVFSQQNQLIQHLSGSLKSRPEQLQDKVASLLTKQKELEKQVEQLKMKLASGAGSDVMAQVQDVNGIALLAVRMDELDSKSLRPVIDQYKQKLKEGVIVLATADGGKVGIAVGVTPELSKQVKAGDLVRQLAEQVGGKGGGRPDFAQAGGQLVEQLDAMMQAVPDTLTKLLN